MNIPEFVMQALAVYGSCRLLESFLFKKKSEPVDGLSYVPRVSRVIGVEMKLELEDGMVNLYIFKPSAEKVIKIELFEFDNKVRQLKNEDELKAIVFVSNATKWNFRDSKKYVDKLQ